MPPMYQGHLKSAGEIAGLPREDYRSCANIHLGDFEFVLGGERLDPFHIFGMSPVARLEFGSRQPLATGGKLQRS